MTRSGRPAVRIAVDLLGGDDAPDAVVDGVLMALDTDPDLTILLAGPPVLLAALLRAVAPATLRRITTLRAEQRVGMADAPVRAVRTRRGASVRVAIEAVRRGEADAAVSAGSTGAVVASAVSALGVLDGIRRPALAVVIPAGAHPVVLLDVGAGTSPGHRDLVGYARLGAAHATALLDVAAPRVGLLSVGTEPGKGDALRRRADRALSGGDLAYAGLVEGHHVPLGGPADVVVTDGFTGNVLLKALEGVVALAGARRGTDDLSGAAPAAVLLGVAGTVVVGHGAARPSEIAGGVALAAKAVRGRHMARVLAALGVEGEDLEGDGDGNGGKHGRGVFTDGPDGHPGTSDGIEVGGTARTRVEDRRVEDREARG